MPHLTLVIANKNYSSWSLRPWLAMTELGIPFAERMVKFDSDDWERNIEGLSPTRLVPVLWEGEPGGGIRHLRLHRHPRTAARTVSGRGHLA